jgi:hypothetical protein
MTDQQSDPLYNQIYNEQNLKSTEDLLAIWQANDRSEWSDEAFAAIQKILLERLGSIPPKPETPARDARAPASESPDTFYDVDKIISLSGLATTVAWIVLVVSVLAGLVLFLIGLSSSSFAAQLVLALLLVLPGLFIFVVLRVLAEGLYLLLEIAENSRRR